MKQKRAIRTLVVLIVILMLLVLCLAGILVFLLYQKEHKEQESQPQAAVEAFITELNERDIDGMLRYIEPSEAELIRKGLEKIEGVSDSALMSLLKKTLPFLEHSGTEQLPEFHPDILSVKEDETTAVVTICFSGSEGQQFYDVHLIRIGESWYIQYAWKADLPADAAGL